MELNALNIVGTSAAILSTLNQFPQAYKVFKTGDTHSISLAMYCIVEVAITLWLVYGIMLNDFPLILANSLSLIPITYIWIVKLINVYKGKDKNRRLFDEVTSTH
ncbi:SemiSWEET family sugar transporter [Haoranjiania flava]|uniref:SemiSWEET family transporter n=1 Tax=Haoranjiania flava TaxID=1856322 RepID=A0AAE3ILC1_9BACT|nr:SemiSWEET family transporter [Haoranjiania flava]MCU7693383.1 SemiSWEET family transporter [Haoranjiania flava]